MRLLGSLAIHALLALLLISTHRVREQAGAAPQIELVDVAVVSIAESTKSESVPGQVREIVSLRGSPSAGNAKASPASSPRMPSNGELRVEPAGENAGGGTGGTDDGNGLGLGNGQGLGELVPATPEVPAPPPAQPAPKVSKARPARLTYPSRQTEVDADRLFVADVIVDVEGFVVGAKLATRSGPRDGEAGALVWRFRYDPALDDDGRPVRSTVHQPFAVAW